MNINKRAKVVVAAAALIGTAGIAGSAFTAAGITNATTPQFIGGEVTQTVTGATLQNIGYRFTDAGHLTIDRIQLTFTDNKADAQLVTVELNDVDDGGFTCVNSGAAVFLCDTATPFTGLDKIDITVSSTQTPVS
jgi:hypothetical protein